MVCVCVWHLKERRMVCVWVWHLKEEEDGVCGGMASKGETHVATYHSAATAP